MFARKLVAIVALGLVVLPSFACDEGGGGKSEPATKSEEVDAVEDFALKSAKDNLAEAKAALAKQEDPSLDCAVVEGYLDGLAPELKAKAKDFVDDAHKTCRRDAPLAWATINLDKVDAEKKKEPDALPIGPCASAETALDTAKQHFGSDPEVVAVASRSDALCGV